MNPTAEVDVIVAGRRVPEQLRPRMLPSRSAELDQAAATFQAARPMLRRIAYQILGDVGDAEDAVQEAWIRWQRSDRATVRNPPAFLVTTTTRVALNIAQSAHHRHEQPVDTWPREPATPEAGPEARAAREEEVGEAMHLVLDRLTPTERAVYLLREVFDYPYSRVATLCGLTPTNARQVVRRARLHLATDRRRPVGADSHRRLVQEFLTAAQTGSLTGLEHLLVTELAR